MNSHSLNELKRTPLYPFYEANNIKLVDFGGWALPIQFQSILKEHEAVRERAGLFDVSHMGQIAVQGKKAEDWLNSLVTNDLSKMKTFQAQYHAVCNEHGGTLDDLIILKMGQDSYFITPNASNTQKILSWFKQHEVPGVLVQDVSENYGLLALQGPLSEAILQRLTSVSFSDLSPFYCMPHVVLDNGVELLVSRTGYTGEDGFELYCAASQTEKLWNSLLKEGESEGLIPCGLGARDTLRLEMGYPLYGQELSEDISPIVGGIGFAVKTKKKSAEYVGKEALAAQRTQGTAMGICGFEMSERGIPRNGYRVFNAEGEDIGYVTSGTKSPTLGSSIGMVLLDREYKTIGTEIFVEIRAKKIKATVVKKPFYQHTATKQN